MKRRRRVGSDETGWKSELAKAEIHTPVGEGGGEKTSRRRRAYKAVSRELDCAVMSHAGSNGG
ncbi:hypothetical protein PILCRDRAFT_809952 [Piloderma croceum F 1598]|uniref:Uncharacterized protein n=1 Tax=Piloderma croceum (strain F 1598) TaxID=765440 RepID=A0A0C3G6U3_PILCF|nr:hypothetical protein PILCRDRAFT_809952 [Piloderma croceum F 1598]